MDKATLELLKNYSQKWQVDKDLAFAAMNQLRTEILALWLQRCGLDVSVKSLMETFRLVPSVWWQPSHAAYMLEVYATLITKLRASADQGPEVEEQHKKWIEELRAGVASTTPCTHIRRLLIRLMAHKAGIEGVDLDYLLDMTFDVRWNDVEIKTALHIYDALNA